MWCACHAMPWLLYLLLPPLEQCQAKSRFTCMHQGPFSLLVPHVHDPRWPLHGISLLGGSPRPGSAAPPSAFCLGKLRHKAMKYICSPVSQQAALGPGSPSLPVQVTTFQGDASEAHSWLIAALTLAAAGQLPGLSNAGPDPIPIWASLFKFGACIPREGVLENSGTA